MIEYTQEELDCMRAVMAKMKEEDDGDTVYINPRFLAYASIVCKCRVDDTIKKIRTFLAASGPCGMDTIESDEDLWSDPQVPAFLEEHYHVCGVDGQGNSILWIKASGIPPELETTSVRAGLIYTMAIHGDAGSLREGVTFVIDFTGNRTDLNQVGNEKRLQKVNQAYPLRPQAILFAGASLAYRVFINALISFASVFVKQKILQRIKFVTMEKCIAKLPPGSAPRYVGGNGGGIENVTEWTRERYYQLPIPEL